MTAAVAAERGRRPRVKKETPNTSYNGQGQPERQRVERRTENQKEVPRQIPWKGGPHTCAQTAGKVPSPRSASLASGTERR